MISKIVVVDVETTGLEPPESKLLEAGAVVLVPDPWRATNWWSSLVWHEGPIGPEAKAAHHITEAMVAPGTSEARPQQEVLADLIHLCGGIQGCVVAAHNSAFDSKFLPDLADYSWLCTDRCSRHLFPDAPRYANQVLRYYLGAEPPAYELSGGHPHRALYDATVTAHVLLHMLQGRSPEELVELTTLPVLQKKVRFGKHRDLEWSQVPAGYLSWMVKSSDMYRDDPDIRHTVDHQLAARRRVGPL